MTENSHFQCVAGIPFMMSQSVSVVLIKSRSCHDGISGKLLPTLKPYRLKRTSREHYIRCWEFTFDWRGRVGRKKAHYLPNLLLKSSRASPWETSREIQLLGTENAIVELLQRHRPQQPYTSSSCVPLLRSLNQLISDLEVDFCLPNTLRCYMLCGGKFILP